ncbi:Alpha-1,3/1,6-mannosyltransferase ALG2 [Hypsizygus marmoreus]|uniref:Alpha-1,3/1,6-mannosyltransferase ALG2 n=1 Tax=Hypsizygus marmoreus TaxID=39966 RepID=A0A369JBA3_HYPMA|nr:Alpha-1,3/1,6-mannosyltransferase ALG2 [Hypsizygus marmoreus]
MPNQKSLRVAFIHPDLGIGGAERLVVDAALGLQERGHSVDIYTSHHDPNHCFEETKDGSLRVHHVIPPFPRSFKGKFHIFFAHARQLHLTAHLLRPGSPKYDVYFVDQLSTCIPFLRTLGNTRVVFYCHFPDKLLANGEFTEGKLTKKQPSLLKWLYRYPMDWLEEVTTRQADVILANSKFTGRVFKAHFKSIKQTPRVVYPGINIAAYESDVDPSDPDIISVTSEFPTLLSLNRFEKKKNAALAIESFAALRSKYSAPTISQNMRLVLAGGYDPRLEDNMLTLYSLIDLVKSFNLTYNVITPASTKTQVKIPPLNVTRRNPDVLFLLNFTTSQRTALLSNPSTIALLYTPANEHFGIGPVEAMGCGVPVLACDSGGPTESILDDPPEGRTGWLRKPDPDVWADALVEIISMNEAERQALSRRAKERARALFGMDAMARGLEEALVEAVGMGEISRFALNAWLMFVGFLIAYFIGPLVLPSSTN